MIRRFVVYMAIRNIVTEGDEILRKVCRKIEKFDDKLKELLEDMAETMYNSNGVGLAAPQVGLLKRIVVIDVGEGLIELINPVIIEKSGEQREVEGCLSIPGEYGITIRPMKVTVEAQDRNGNYFQVKGEGLLARAFCHEIDHIDGILFKDRVVRMLDKSELN